MCCNMRLTKRNEERKDVAASKGIIPGDELSTLRDEVKRLRAENEQLKLYAKTDLMTGLGNRRAYDEAVIKAIAGFRRRSEQGRNEREKGFVLVILDLNGLKEVNDSMGHEYGDMLIMSASAVIKKTMRSSDNAFRIGGDEFAVILDNTSTSLEFAKRLDYNLREKGDDPSLALGWASILDPLFSENPELTNRELAKGLFAAADQMMYENKRLMKLMNTKRA